ncbi:hypothetical protein AMTRI_Chr01g132500 [Amborella trichopoda]
MAKEHKVRLLGTWRSPFVYRVRLAVKLNGIEYECIEVDLKNKSPLLLESNLVHKLVPVLIHGNNPVSESSVILEFIDETWPENPLMPHDHDIACMAPMKTVLSTEGVEQEKAMTEIKEALKTLEGGLKGRFFSGEVIGFVDIAASSLSIWSEVLGEIVGTKFIDSETLPLLRSYFPPYNKLIASYKARREDHLAAKFFPN